MVTPIKSNNSKCGVFTLNASGGDKKIYIAGLIIAYMILIQKLQLSDFHWMKLDTVKKDKSLWFLCFWAICTLTTSSTFLKKMFAVMRVEYSAPVDYLELSESV